MIIFTKMLFTILKGVGLAIAVLFVYSLPGMIRYPHRATGMGTALEPAVIFITAGLVLLLVGITLLYLYFRYA